MLLSHARCSASALWVGGWRLISVHVQAARDIAHTMSQSANKIYLSAENLLVNVVRAAHESFVTH